MGSKYRKALEIEWDNKPLSAMRIKMLQEEADRNITGLVSGKFKRRRR